MEKCGGGTTKHSWKQFINGIGITISNATFLSLTNPYWFSIRRYAKNSCSRIRKKAQECWANITSHSSSYLEHGTAKKSTKKNDRNKDDGVRHRLRDSFDSTEQVIPDFIELDRRFIELTDQIIAEDYALDSYTLSLGRAGSLNPFFISGTCGSLPRSFGCSVSQI